MKQLLLFFLLSISAVAQKSFLVKDSSTNEPIAYTSIFTENGTFKVNAEPDGSFMIPNKFLHEVFVFDAVGYEPKQQLLTDTVLLEPKSEVLDEVVIVPKLGTKEVKVGSIKKKLFSSYNYGMGANTDKVVWSFGRMFPYFEEYSTTPFIKKITFLLRSKDKNSTYEIKIYEADEDGKPNQLLHDNFINGVAEKGYKKSQIDLSELNIEFPKNGIVIVFDWLTIQENLVEDRHDNEIRFKYNPNFEAEEIKNPNEALVKISVIQTEWKTTTESKITFDENKAYSFMCEITLTN